MTVPFLDLKGLHEPIQQEIETAIQEVIARCAFAGGPFVEKFEQQFAAFCNSDYAVGVGSGTEALWLALLALGVGPGDEIITVPNTFIATAEAISFCGATPVFVDVLEATHNLNPELLEAAITPRTKGMIPVHLYGQMADMDPIMEIARAHGLFVVEDASQAHGSQYKGRFAGSIGDAGCFSFYPGKNLGAFGEAGAVISQSADLTYKIQQLRDHGQKKKYFHDLVGWNGRMDGIQAAVLSVKLKYLADWNAARRTSADHYTELLSDVAGLRVPSVADYGTHSFHVYAIQIQERDRMLEALVEKQIYCGIHYPVPLHLQNAYATLGFKQGSFPIAEKSAAHCLSLPMFPGLKPAQIDYVVEGIKACLG